MRNDENGYIALTKQFLGDDAPEEQPIPTLTFGDGEESSWGKITLVADELGVGEADSMSVFFEPSNGFIFAGDIVDNGMTPFMMEGQSRQWLLQIESMRREYSTQGLVVFPGHGPRAGSTLFQEGEDILSWVRGAVGEKLSSALSEIEIDDFVDRYNTLYPGRPAVAAVPDLMRENVRAVAEELMVE